MSFEVDIDKRIEEAELACKPEYIIFAKEVSKGSKREDAAELAGFCSDKTRDPKKRSNSLKATASRLIKNKSIANLIRLYAEKFSLEHGIPASWKRDKLYQIINVSMGAVQNDGDDDSPLVIDHHAAIRAIDILNKMDGAYMQNVKVEGELTLSSLLDKVVGGTGKPDIKQ